MINMGPRLPTVEVSTEIINILFDQFDIWSQINEGHLTSFELPPTPAKGYIGASSLIIKHFKPNGKHIAATHCIRNKMTGKILHWDAKDLRLNDIRLWRH
jgi:hypothetical protein